MPVSGELPFPQRLDLQDDASFKRVWAAQMPQVGIPFMGLPALTVSTGLVGRVPVGVQLVAGRYREDLCLLAGEAIEAGGTPASPIDPVRTPIRGAATMTSIYDFSAKTLARRGAAAEAVRGPGAADRQHRQRLRVHAAIQGPRSAAEDTTAPRGFSVLGFPCNQFGAQEPGDEAQIAQFCSRNYGVSFPMFAKIDVNGAQAHPLYKLS